MNMKGLIVKAIKKIAKERDERQYVLLEELLNDSWCAVAHSFRLSGQPRDLPLNNRVGLKKAVHREFDKTLREYFSSALDGSFVSDENLGSVNRIVKYSILGRADMGLEGGESFVFSSYRNSEDLDGTTKIKGAYLASLLPSNKAFAVVVNPSSLKWSVYQISGSKDLEDAVTMDADFLEGVCLGLAPKEGVEEECPTCVFKKSCSVDVKFSGKPYPLRDIDWTKSQAIEQLLENHLESINQLDDGRNTGFLSPSEMSISDCERRMVYKLLKTPRKAEIPSNLRKIFAMGHAVHEVVQRAAHEVSDAFNSERTARFPETLISGSCDGDLGDEGLEIKSMSEAGFKSLKSPKTEHKKQGSIYAHALGLKRMLFVYYEKKTGSVAFFYENPSAPMLAEIRSRAKTAEVKAKKKNGLPPRTISWGCGTCAYKYTCKPEENG